MIISSATYEGSDKAEKRKESSTRYEPEQKTVSGMFILYRNTNKLIFFLKKSNAMSAFTKICNI